MLLRGADVIVSLDPPTVTRADVAIEGGTIVDPAAGGRERDVVDVGGALVVPGLVNAHTHLYSALARGMPGPAVPPRSFLEVLEQVWWRLDRALDRESVELSALVGAAEAALSGTTLLVDHHSSPSFVRGSLQTLARAIERVGLRSVLCYETTDRNGAEGRDLGLEENATFLAAEHGPLTRGMVGAHASFTLSDESVSRLARTAAATNSGVHVHVAEDRCDVEDCRTRHGRTLPARLAPLVSERALLAHCVHLEPAELGGLQDAGAWIAHNPRSNMNNHVGHAPTSALRRAALGTDGIDGDMWAETRAAFLKMRDAGRADAGTAALDLLAGGHRLASALFGKPFGRLEPGAPADLVVLDYAPPTPLHGGNVVGHLLFGVDRSHVHSVMVDGRWVVRERRLVTLDRDEVFARARRSAPAVWRRMGEL
jgi:putative selenium metabolism protein SsnA